MLNKIINFSVNNKLIIALFILALIGYGSFQFTKLPIDAVPDITNNQVQVITIAPSLGATDIERLVTFPIEMANSNISGLHEIRSFSRFGLSLVTIVFDDNIDIYWARQQVSERIISVQSDIPKGVANISLGPITTGLGEIYQYTLRAAPGYEKKYDAIALRSIQDWVVRRQLLGVKGVADVSSFGGKLKQYEIAIEPTKLKAHQVSIAEIFQALENNNQNTGGAYIEKGPIALYIRSEGLIKNKEDILSIFIKNNSNGTPLLIRDIAEINIGNATRYGALCYNDEGEVSGAVVMMLKNENSSMVIKNIKERIALIQKTLPKGVVLEPFLDRTKMVNNAIGTVETNLLEGALIVLFVLVLFLGNLRAGLLVASVIPLSMLIAVILMNVFNVSGNLMSLGALDFGLIIDGAVIIVEAVLHSLHHHKKNNINYSFTKNEMDNHVKNSASRMMNSAVFGQVIILVVYLPIFFLSGIEGKMFKPMVQTVVFALIGAFILSLTYVPMMSAWVLSKKQKHKQNLSDIMMIKFEHVYQTWLKKALQIPKLIISIILLLFTIAIFILSNLGGEFIPTLEEGDFAIEFRVLPGSNLNTTIERSQKAAHILKNRFPEVIQVVTKIGSGEIPSDPMPLEAADMMVILKDKKEWTSARTFPELAEKMGKALQDVPGITASFQYPVQMRFNELMTGAKQDVVCKIFGENLDTLAFYAQKLGNISDGIQGAKNIFVETVVGMPEIIIDFNRQAIAQYGLNINEINKVVNTALAGQSAGLVYEGEKHFDLVVRLKNTQRNSIEDVKNLLINTHNGTQIPLTQVAHISLKEGPNQIQREDAKRRIIVGFNTRGRDVESIVNELQEKVNKKIKLPSGYYITYGGSFENLNAAKDRLAITVPIALILIFLFLFFAFGSIKQSLLIYSAIPLSAIGGIFALAFREMPFSISAGIGFIALFGVAVLNGIVLIAEFNRLKSLGKENIQQIIMEGTQARLRPILMTAFVASLGFLPMALSNGAGAEVQRPLATVVIGGLLIATFLTLFVLPILYQWFEKGNFKLKVSIINVGIIIGLFLLSSKPLIAQEPIQYGAALDSVILNNLILKSEKFNVEYYKQLKKSAWNIDQTSVITEYGQVNSIYYDTKFSITQGIKFPTYYIKKMEILNHEWEKSTYSLEAKKCELKKEVSYLFNQLIYTKKLMQLFQESDSIYDIYVYHAKLKFEKGENNLLEKNSALWHQAQIKIQLNQVNIEYENLLLEFNLLLNTKNLYAPQWEDKYIKLEANINDKLLENHPSLLMIKQDKLIANNRLSIEKSMLLPIIHFGYNNMSIKGIGADNIQYGANQRFQSFQAGLGIPLFFNSQYAIIKAEKLQELKFENEYLLKSKSLNLAYTKAVQQYQASAKKLNYFEKEGNELANQMSKSLAQQHQGGNISYIEWVLLQQQIISIKSSYLEALKELDNAIVELNYLNHK
ncbi:MAG TPA: CusA/CzcA family heavy metal efflux RND transporter [Bacteroidia bacterium]|nr:CusA/CzcA family heavy metal efflux RND transporter [Bacteroidia bacterium]